ncbi:hypothetical protein PVAND_005443 [Polypedilum vanderplanki]|uniref:Protein kinase domain-containing protein n=1 Tax=Polypedilum vanderplanki TaxID=319348 RepID=A0A9J6C153_POLVA|nr:hypothetical protein PVAND_005443 [Polypedilum vanderplanki]
MAEYLRKRTVDVSGLERRGYRFGKKIGKGSYGNVIEAKFIEPGTNNIVDLACKYVDKNKVPIDFLEKFFPRELHFLTILAHPNLIRVHSIMQTGSSVFIFMRCAENGDLLNYIKNNGVINEAQSNLWFYQMASAIQYLHSMNIAHRDLKCDNIFISEHMNIKVGDFGFMRYCCDENNKFVPSETYCGSAAYAAPEIVNGQPYNPMIADIWSLGVVLSIMLYGTMPFDDTNTRKLLRDQKMRRISINVDIRNKLSEECLQVHSLCLEPNASQRLNINQLLALPWMKKQVDKRNKMKLGLQL